jgi:BirA family biotin operon repressor/biotin-[acetyl-CoA-carboxylase] ligase
MHIAWPQGYSRLVLDQIDSTNAESLRRASAASGPGWILAHRQTQGRGRRGRPWVDPVGNFAASLTLFPTTPPAQTALRSFIAALSLYQALVQLGVAAEHLSLKWPNDVLLNGRKLAGILLEASVLPDGRAVLIVGIGVNLQTAPTADALEARALGPCSLQTETGLHIQPENLLNAIAAQFAQYEDQFITHGFAPIRRAWLDRAAFIGAPITARVGPDAIDGIFADVDADGALILQTDHGRRAIAAADVFAKE